MKLEGDNIFEWVETVAMRAERFIVVSPFFTTNGKIIRLLKFPRDLKILIGDEFSTNDPGPLERLSELESRDIRCVYKYRGDFDKVLHAKVFYAVESSGRQRALVGSANFTVSGLSRNKEQAVSFDSDCKDDGAILEAIERWIDELDKYAEKIDWEEAKMKYERNAIPHFPTDDFDAYRRGQAENHWVLKTTRGSRGPSHWEDFCREGVVSIGWEDVVEIATDEYGVQPNEYTLDTLNAAADQWAEGLSYRVNTGNAARMLHKFTSEFSIGDRIILCRGYGDTQTVDVLLYGLAVVDGDAVYHAASKWWKLKRRAVLQREEREIPKDVFVNALGKGSLRSTIHWISEDEYEEFRRRIQAL